MRETFRVWAENIETFYLDVISERRPGFWAAFWRVTLFLFSKVFLFAIRMRRFLYNVRILRDSTLGVQVIAIQPLQWNAQPTPPSCGNKPTSRRVAAS